MTDGTGSGSSSLHGPLLSLGEISYYIILKRCADVSYSNGGASVFQLTLHKNINAYPRVLGVTNHNSILVKTDKTIS